MKMILYGITNISWDNVGQALKGVSGVGHNHRMASKGCGFLIMIIFRGQGTQ
jgi:ADP-ribosylglycohydrolase